MDTATEEFDVRSLIPIKRYEKMVKFFKELPAGDSFIFINDHDLKPLCYQMEAENSEPFKWEYLMTMPQEWKVKVMKLEA